MARYSDNELRALYNEMSKSKDRGVRGLTSLMMSIWRIDDVDWKAVRKELLNLRSGRALVKRIEALPNFEEIAGGGYQKVVSVLDRDGKKRLFDMWEGTEQRFLGPIEDEWVDYRMKMKEGTDRMAGELLRIAKELVAESG